MVQSVNPIITVPVVVIDNPEESVIEPVIVDNIPISTNKGLLTVPIND